MRERRRGVHHTLDEAWPPLPRHTPPRSRTAPPNAARGVAFRTSRPTLAPTSTPTPRSAFVRECSGTGSVLDASRVAATGRRGRGSGRRRAGSPRTGIGSAVRDPSHTRACIRSPSRRCRAAGVRRQGVASDGSGATGASDNADGGRRRPGPKGRRGARLGSSLLVGHSGPPSSFLAPRPRRAPRRQRRLGDRIQALGAGRAARGRVSLVSAHADEPRAHFTAPIVSPRTSCLEAMRAKTRTGMTISVDVAMIFPYGRS